MTNLSPVQFSDENEREAGGVPLPGMEKRSPFARTSDWADERENREYRTEKATRETRLNAQAPVRDRWSGPDPHQLIMGVHDLGANNGQFDAHGFVSERSRGPVGEHDLPRLDVPTVSPDENHLGSGGNGVSAKNFYRTIGGSKSHDFDVQQKWDAQPTHMVRSDTPVHTQQRTDETEWGKALNDVQFRDANPGVLEGRQRVNAIRDDVEQGNPIQKPAWLLKHNNRLFALDGHHRIVAAREGGLSHYPAKVWDMDAPQKPQQTVSGQ